jgi:hypothetical protein
MMGYTATKVEPGRKKEGLHRSGIHGFRLAELDIKSWK